MTTGPDWLPSLGTDTTTSVIEDGLDALAAAAGPAASASLGLATLSNPAMLLLGSVAAPIAEEKTVELSKKVDLRLRQYIEETNGDERAYLRKLAVGVSTLLPDGEELNEAAIEAARGDPARLRELLEEYAGERRGELERTVDRILRGDVDDLEETLCEAFGTRNVDEAQALFMNFRDVIESRRVHDTFERLLDIEGELDGVAEELVATRSDMHERFKQLQRTRLRNEGFVRLGPAYFDGEIKEPASAWRAGFSLQHVRAGLAVERESRRDPDRTITDELLDSLTEGQHRLVVGPAGSGKSVVCKSVACEWYDRRETGPVLYRRSGRGGEPFRSVGTLIAAIRETDRRTLVVVEDVFRSESEQVIEVIEQVDDGAATFLLDARPTEQLDELDHNARHATHPAEATAHQGVVEVGTIGTDMHGTLVDELRRLASERYDFPSTPTVAEVKAVFESFERATGRTVDASAAAAHQAIETDADVGSMLHLSYYLPFETQKSEGLQADVALKYNIISGAEDPSDYPGDIADLNTGLRQDIATMIALLVAAGLGNHPELVHALVRKHIGDGDDESYTPRHEEIRDIREALRNWFVYPASDDADVRWTTHERWAELYLAQLEADTTEDDAAGSRLQLGQPNRFRECVDALLAVATDDNLRQHLRDVFPDSGLLRRIDDDPAAFASSATRDVLDVGRSRPALYPLYDFESAHGVRVDPDWPAETRATVREQMASICAAYGNVEQAREYLTESRTLYEQADATEELAGALTQLGQLAMAEYDRAEELLQQGRQLYDDVDAPRGVACADTNLARLARLEGDWDRAHELFHKAYTTYDELGDERNIAISLMNLGAVERDRNDEAAAREYLEEAYDRTADMDARVRLADCLTNLGGLEHDQTNHEAARDYLQRAYDIYAEFGYRARMASVLNSRGAVELTSGNPKSAREYFEDSRALYDELDARLGVAYTLGSLGVAARQLEEYDTALDRLKESRELYEAVGFEEGLAMALRDLGGVTVLTGDTKEARKYYGQALDHLRSLGADAAVQETFETVIELCEDDGDSDAALKWCERAKLWAESADVDTDDAVAHFLVYEYGQRVTEDTTEKLFLIGVSQFPAQSDRTARIDLDVRPFEYLWERRDAYSPGDGLHFYAMSGGVYLVAVARAIDTSVTIDDEAVLETVERQASRLASGASVLFEYLSTGSTEMTVETLTTRAQPKSDPAAQADLFAAAFLLNRLNTG